MLLENRILQLYAWWHYLSLWGEKTFTYDYSTQPVIGEDEPPPEELPSREH